MTDLAPLAVTYADGTAWAFGVDLGPLIAEGFSFPGCSDWRGPGHLCMCETWRPVACDRCGGVIRDGQEYATAIILAWAIGSDEDVEEDEVFWHHACPHVASP
jgi:hypothetical protein